MYKSHHPNSDTDGPQTRRQPSSVLSDEERGATKLPTVSSVPADLQATLNSNLLGEQSSAKLAGDLIDDGNVTASGDYCKFVPKPSKSLKTDGRTDGPMALAVSSRSVAFPCEIHHSRHACMLRQPISLHQFSRGFVSLSKSRSVDENRGRICYRVRCSSSAACEEEEDSANAVESISSNRDSRISASEGSSLHLREIPCAEKSGHFVLPKMNRRAAVFNSMAFLGAGGGLCACCCNAAMAGGGVEDWNYGDTRWGGSCAIGARQSPIDVRVNKAMHGEALGELQFEYKLCTPTFKNPGHGTMQVNFIEGVNKLRVNGRELNLVQFHFHAPSEHAFEGVRFPMEAHLVHQDIITKAYAVVGVMLDATADAYSNGALTAALQYSPLEHGKTLTLLNVQVSANDLLPLKVTKEDRRYIHYLGSFTTPPCTESVDWFLLEKALRVSTSEVLEFMKFVGDEQTLGLNARPLQPLGDREVFEGP